MKWLFADYASADDFNVIVRPSQRIKDLLIRGAITSAQPNQNIELACRCRVSERSLQLLRGIRLLQNRT